MSEESFSTIHNDPKAAYRAACNLLARREHAHHELKQKLQQRKFTLSAIEQAMTKLNQQNLLSEQRFVASYVRSRIAKAYGPNRIRAELQNRRIQSDLIEQELNVYADVWLTKIEQVIAKRFHAIADRDSYQRAVRFLQYRGFDLELILAAMADKKHGS